MSLSLFYPFEFFDRQQENVFVKIYCEIPAHKKYESCTGNCTSIHNTSDDTKDYFISVGILLATVILSVYHAIPSLYKICHTLKFFFPLPRRFFGNKLNQLEETIGTFGISGKSLDYDSHKILRLPRYLGVPVLKKTSLRLNRSGFEAKYLEYYLGTIQYRLCIVLYCIVYTEYTLRPPKVYLEIGVL